MCRACGVDRELIEIEHANASFDVPHFRCPICNDVLRLAVRQDDGAQSGGDRFG
ncbi:hypothetical protein RPPS3_22290 [Rhodopseudomonas palustris]|nr:hypothetical protein RPPS3_22290 [Rhodopseudomonas palustris]